MDIIGRIPEMPDDALTTLCGNAQRLELTGTASQKAAASALLPAIKAELAERRAAKLAIKAETAALAPKIKRVRVTKSKAVSED